jgi:hypothetical protein
VRELLPEKPGHHDAVDEQQQHADAAEEIAAGAP